MLITQLSDLVGQVLVDFVVEGRARDQGLGGQLLEFGPVAVEVDPRTGHNLPREARLDRLQR